MIDWARNALIRIWRIRGGGLYGLGFMITFVILEIRGLAGDVAETESDEQFVSQQMFEIAFRFIGETFLNTMKSFIWPVFVIDALGFLLGGGLLIAAFVGFDRLARPYIEDWLPELKKTSAKKTKKAKAADR